MKKLTKIQKIHLISATLILMLCFYHVLSKEESLLNQFISFVYRVEDTIFSNPVYMIKAKSEEDTDVLEAENQTLKMMIQQLEQQLELKESLVDYEKISATVISRPIDGYSNSLTLNVGKKDGIDDYYAVMSSAGVIGRISHIYDYSCDVQLLTSETTTNQFTVKILLDETNSCDAVLQNYDSAHNCYIVKLLSTSKSISPKMKVVTSGLGGILPYGLLIGEVDSIYEDSDSLGVSIYVTPAADYSNLLSVQIVKKK